MNTSNHKDIEENLRAQKARYPLMNDEDTVKFVFQAMLGVGHLIASRDGALERLMQEMDAQEPYEGEPLTEALSDEWFRLNLRAARSRGIPAADIADMLLFSAGQALSYSRRDVYDFCVQLDKSEWMRKAAEKVMDGHWLPSHSEAYRAAYRPSYRVLHRTFLKKCSE
ncbi:MAG: hypothetical protein IJU28_04445 [Clostridia bacterium]|nr:hypothetical protein [Clostridia bacterium]